jgi:hypothetical protein
VQLHIPDFANVVALSSYKTSNTVKLKGIVSRDFGTPFLFHWIDLKVVIGPDQV